MITDGLLIGELAKQSGITPKAQRLGFSLEEIHEIVSIKRAGSAPCAYVRELVSRKAAELDARLKDLAEMRDGLRALLSGWRSTGPAIICPIIEAASWTKKRGRTGRPGNGQREDVAVSNVRSLPRSRDHRRRGTDR